MGARGPQRTPTPILQARGSRQPADRLGEVEYTRGRPTCPEWLSVEAKREWTRVADECESAGVLQLVDRAMLTCWCEAWADLKAACAAMAKLKPADAIAQGLANSRSKAVERLMRLAGLFGFSPAARSRIRTPEGPQEGPADGKSRYFA